MKYVTFEETEGDFDHFKIHDSLQEAKEYHLARYLDCVRRYINSGDIGEDHEVDPANFGPWQEETNGFFASADEFVTAYWIQKVLF